MRLLWLQLSVTLWVITVLGGSVVPASAQIQQAWVVKYNNGVTNGDHQALKIALDNAGYIYLLGVSANANTNTGYVVVKYAPNGSQIWAARYDSTNYPAASPAGFALDSSNNVVVTGNALTLKYDANGNLLWTAPYNGTAIAVDPVTNVYITGVSGNFTTVKLNSAGSNFWAETATFEGYANLSEGIAIDSMTNVYVAGSETDYNYRGFAYVRFAMIKYDPTGRSVWTWNSGGGVDNILQFAGIALDSSGNVYLEGNLIDATGPFQTFKINSGGTTAWYDSDPTGFGGSSATGLTVDRNGNVVVTGGNAQFYPNDCYGTYEIGASGDYIWTNLFPNINSGNSVATSIGLDQANSVYVTGFSPALGTNGNSEIVTIKYDSNGSQLWLQRYDGPGNGNDVGNAIAVDNSGNVYVAGYETETNGFTSMILIKYSPVTVQKQSNGNFILQASGSPGESFDIQASTNLQSWVDLGEVIADTNGLVQFDDTNAASFPARFYYIIPQ
jgi:hypothetical protein